MTKTISIEGMLKKFMDYFTSSVDSKRDHSKHSIEKNSKSSNQNLKSKSKTKIKKQAPSKKSSK